MKRLALAFAPALAVSLVLLPGTAGAQHHAHGVHEGSTSTGCCVFIGPGRDFAPRPFGLHHHFFFPPSSTVILVNPVSQPVWTWAQGFWGWDGWQWVWIPGRWAFPSQGLILRNPCD